MENKNPKDSSIKKESINEKKIKILTKKLEEATGKKVLLKEAGSNLQSKIETINKSEQGFGGSGYSLELSADGSGVTIFLVNSKGEGGNNIYRGTVKEASVFIQGMFVALRIKNGFIK